MKIAVYAIAKNEEQFVERWAISAKAADFLTLLDTGSSDSTVQIAKSLGISVSTTPITPWRFDAARNLALKLVPETVDYCIALDLDEILIDGWRESLEIALSNSWTRPRYKYTWSWNSDGSPGLVYGGDKIHARHGYIWKHPVHEVLVPDGIQETQGWLDLEIHHYPDSTKSRAQYFPLLELAVSEDPEDDRNSFYYARELFFNMQLKNAAAEFKRHLSLSSATWPPERSASMRFLAKCEPNSAESWLLKACAEAPGRREAWVDLAMYYYCNEQWEPCLAAATKAISITEKPLEYLCESEAWGDLPYDLAAISSYRLGMFDKAVEYGTAATNLSKDQRLELNLALYQEAALSRSKNG